jgi:prepilin peptidase CpaA
MCAALLAIAASADVAQRRIPNVVVTAIAALGLAMRASAEGVVPAAACLGGGLLVGALLVLPWRAGLLGGGDVKLAAAAAVCVGPPRLVQFALATALVGGAVAAASFAAALCGRGAVEPAGRRAGSVAALRAGLAATTPYGAAIAAGATYALLFGAMP